MKSPIPALVAAAGILVSAVAPAFAGDVQGDAYGCQELWVMRNQIYKANGYCFHTSRAINYFGNAGCSYDDEYAVPLSKSERRTIQAIKGSERRQGC